MKRAEAKKIIKDEGLVSHHLFEKREDASDEMVIRKEAGKWVVYATNERAARITEGEAVYETEEEALDHFIRRLRALNRVRNL